MTAGRTSLTTGDEPILVAAVEAGSLRTADLEAAGDDSSDKANPSGTARDADSTARAKTR
jgi:hypothetical protein